MIFHAAISARLRGSTLDALARLLASPQPTRAVTLRGDLSVRRWRDPPVWGDRLKIQIDLRRARIHPMGEVATPNRGGKS